MGDSVVVVDVDVIRNVSVRVVRVQTARKGAHATQGCSVTSREGVPDERNCDAEWEARMGVSRDSVVSRDPRHTCSQ